MTDYAQAVRAMRTRIAAAERRYDRKPGSVSLLVVTKTRPVADVRAAYGVDQRQFGESYLQEAIPKIRALSAETIEWHFIGPIQSNKTRGIAGLFSWVHSVDRLKIAQRLDAQRPENASPINICLEVNISAETSKSGASPAEVPALARELARLPRLRLRGLMAIPPASDDFETQRRYFHQLRELRDALSHDIPALDTLSMGMTSDLEAAVAEGATIVRIGSGIFGSRSG